MLFKSILLFAITGSSLALPNGPSFGQGLQKRSEPIIRGEDYTDTQKSAITRGHNEAITLAVHALSMLSQSDPDDTRLQKYFPAGSSSRSTVKQVYEQIIGDPVDGVYKGSSKLENIRVVDDYNLAGTGHYACSNLRALAVLREYNNRFPKMIVCPAGFRQTPLLSISCDTLGEDVSDAMESLGASILHEYTHYTKLISPPLAGSSTDDQYGWYNSQAFAPYAESLQNADSYAWFAIEAYFTIKCHRNFGPWYDECSDE